MTSSIHILHLEDDPMDAELIQAKIEDTGFECRITRVQTRDEFERALRRNVFDVILGDYHLPMYDGLSALQLAQELCPDIPFIFVSGTMGEEAAIEALTKGATDYVLKHGLMRLGSAVERALREGESRRERERAQRALKESEAKMRGILDNIGIGVSLISPGMEILEMNARMREWFPAIDPGQRPICYQVYNDPPRSEICDYCPTCKTLRDGLVHEAVTQTPLAGVIRNFRIVSSPIFNMAGEVTYAIEMVEDITEKLQSQEDLQNTNEMLRAIIEAAPTAIIDLDMDGNVHSIWNPAAERMLGWSAQEVIGRPLPAVPKDRENEFMGLRDQVRRGITLDGVEVRRQRRDGTPIDYSIYASPLYDTENRVKGSIAVLVDITERKRIEEEHRRLQAQLIQAHKMEAIGTLTGGISHDFNNLLQAINGYSEMLLFDITENDPTYNSLQAINSASRRAAELVRQLLLFSRKVETVRKPIDLNQAIEQAHWILQRTIPKMIDIEVRRGSHLRTIEADPVQIEQMILNLGTNAADAMPDGGKLLIETENAYLDEDYARKHLGARPGRYVLLKISDTGSGMDKKTMEKIFEPYFTTKEIGKGTGLGLASVYGIVKSHDGYITCYSEIGLGTTFTIYLPAVEQEDVSETQAAVVKQPKGGTETILLIDDEEWIREVSSQALQKFGYTILTASSGEEALEIYSNKSNDIDLVILDIGMPGMGGYQCLKGLLELDPAVKVMVASGYAMNEQVKKTLEAGAVGYIGKPYRIAELLDKTRDVLEG